MTLTTFLLSCDDFKKTLSFDTRKYCMCRTDVSEDTIEQYIIDSHKKVYNTNVSLTRSETPMLNLFNNEQIVKQPHYDKFSKKRQQKHKNIDKYMTIVEIDSFNDWYKDYKVYYHLVCKTVICSPNFISSTVFPELQFADDTNFPQDFENKTFRDIYECNYFIDTVELNHKSIEIELPSLDDIIKQYNTEQNKSN